MELKPTVISTFCGTGGSSLGYKWAGFRELLAIDFDNHAVECFKLNFPEVPIWNRSICDVTAEEILEFCKIKKGDLDVLDGSPPCQGFSTAGKRMVNDSRNDLFKEYIRLIDGLQPKVFVMENVSGMAKGKMKGNFIDIMKALKGLPYQVKAKQMNSVNYGVPQSRQRIIFIGSKNGLPIPTYPAKQTTITNVKTSLADLPDNPKTCAWLKPEGRIFKLWDKILGGKTLATSINQTSGFSLMKINPLKPCPTICKTSGGILHWEEKRPLSIEEIKRLSSFPDNWKLTGKIKDQWARIGNAVMPRFMQAVAQTIKDDILNAPAKR